MSILHVFQLLESCKISERIANQLIDDKSVMKQLTKIYLYGLINHGGRHYSSIYIYITIWWIVLYKILKFFRRFSFFKKNCFSLFVKDENNLFWHFEIRIVLTIPRFIEEKPFDHKVELCSTQMVMPDPESNGWLDFHF